jgi:hypothetical protein
MSENDTPTAAELLGEVEDLSGPTSLTGEIAAEAAAPIEPSKPKARRARAPVAQEPEDFDEPASADPDRLHPLLTNEEVLAAREEARKQLLAEQIKAAKKKIIADEMQRLRTEGGMSTGDGVKDQMVRITLDLAPHSPFVVLNHRPYYHAQTYTVPRHVAETLREIQQRGWRHQDEIDGKTLSEHYQRARQTGLSPVKGVINPPQAMAS